MKKVLVGAVSAVALSLALAAMPAQAAGLNGSELCKAYNNFGASHGECTSAWESNKGTVAFCKWAKDTFPAAFDASFKNLGQCVSELGKWNNGG